MEIKDLNNEAKTTMHKNSFNLRSLRLSLKFRPKIFKLVLKMRHKIRKKTRLIKVMKQQLKYQIHSTTTTINASTQTEDSENDNIQDIPSTNNNSDFKQADNIKYQNVFTQTDQLQRDKLENKINENQDIKDGENSVTENSNVTSEKNSGWSLNSEENEKSIAEQVKEAAQSAMQQSGMVFVESAGMYYDYKTGYYYSADLGLYYHPDTGCYYRYSEDKQTFEFHSYPDRSKIVNPEYEAHEKRKARKLKKARQREEADIDNLTKNLSQGKEEEGSKAKRRKKNKKVLNGDSDIKESENKANADENAIGKEKESPEKGDIFDDADIKENAEKKTEDSQDLEEGECSDSEDEKEDKMEEEEVESDDSVGSMSTISNDDDSIAKHHPPSMRVIVRETNLPKLKVGTLFLVTKDGGTVGREGSTHTILIEDYNVSRNHLDIKYDINRRAYTVTDLGSKNGTTLNGVRISESQIVSEPVEVMHGSTLQLGETKLLCHIHPGIDTCGHCEPGLVMETQEKEKKAAYTRTCSVQKQHQLELARLKNKYAPKPLAIEETAYNDRAKERRDKVGSSHHSEKTQSADLDTFIAPENKGFKLLEKMGWSKGEGLGKDSQGDTEPIPLVCNEGTSGLGTGAAAAPSLIPKFVPKNLLGASTLRLAAKTKMLQPPAKAFQDPEEDDGDDE